MLISGEEIFHMMRGKKFLWVCIKLIYFEAEMALLSSDPKQVLKKICQCFIKSIMFVNIGV